MLFGNGNYLFTMASNIVRLDLNSQLVIFVAFCFIVFNKVSGIPEPRDTAHRIFTTV